MKIVLTLGNSWKDHGDHQESQDHTLWTTGLRWSHSNVWQLVLVDTWAMWPLILRAANRVKEEAVKGLDALIRNLTKRLPLHSIVQKKSQGYPRVKRRRNRLHLLMGEVQRYGFFENNLPWTANPFQNQVVVASQTFDAACSTSHMMRHLVVHLSPLSAWEIHKQIRSPVSSTGGNTSQFRLRLCKIYVGNRGWTIILL